jgi:hypothetical protein
MKEKPKEQREIDRFNYELIVRFMNRSSCFYGIVVFLRRRFLLFSRLFRKEKVNYSDIEFVVLDGPDSPTERVSSKARINARGDLCV